MESGVKKWIWALAVAAVCSPAAWAADGQTVAELAAGGEPKELALDRGIRVIGIECISGTVTVDSVVVREGAAESPIGVDHSFQPGETKDIDLGYERQVTGLRIRDSGQGAYRVSVK